MTGRAKNNQSAFTDNKNRETQTTGWSFWQEEPIVNDFVGTTYIFVKFNGWFLTENSPPTRIQHCELFTYIRSRVLYYFPRFAQSFCSLSLRIVRLCWRFILFFTHALFRKPFDWYHFLFRKSLNNLFKIIIFCWFLIVLDYIFSCMDRILLLLGLLK